MEVGEEQCVRGDHHVACYDALLRLAHQHKIQRHQARRLLSRYQPLFIACLLEVGAIMCHTHSSWRE